MYTILMSQIPSLTQHREDPSELLCGGLTLYLATLDDIAKSEFVQRLNGEINAYVQARDESGLAKKAIIVPTKTYITDNRLDKSGKQIKEMMMAEKGKREEKVRLKTAIGNNVDPQRASVPSLKGMTQHVAPTMPNLDVASLIDDDLPEEHPDVYIGGYDDRVDYGSLSKQTPISTDSKEEDDDDGYISVSSMGKEDEEKYDGSVSEV